MSSSAPCSSRSLPSRIVGAAFLALSASAQGVRVNPPLAHSPGFGAEDVLGFRIAPDGAWVAFLADSELGENVFELFGVPTDGSAAPRRLNGPLVAGGNLATVWVDPDYEDYVEPPWIAISPEGRVVYRGDQDVDEVFELYSAPIDGSAPPVKLSGTMVEGGDVLPAFLLGPDGTHVLFFADRDTDGVVELYSVPTDGSAAPVRLNDGPLPGGGFSGTGGLPVAVAPDGATVVYLLDQTTSSQFELWSVPIDGSAAPVRLSGSLVSGGDVREFAISPDGTQVLFRADREVNDVFELWSALLDGSTPPARVNGTLVAGGDVSSFAISPDGTRAVYLADQELDGALGLYAATLSGPPAVVRLSAAPAAGLGVFEMRIAPDASRVVFRGRVLDDQVYELFAVPIDGSAAPVRLNDELVDGGDVGDNSSANSFRVTADGTRVVYWADQATVDVKELWSVPIDRSSAPVRVSGPLVEGGDVVRDFRLTADGSRVLYLADQRVNERYELWSAPCDGSALPLRLSGNLVTGGDVQFPDPGPLELGFDATADGTRVVYRADQRVNDLFALWSVPGDRSSAPRELNAVLDPGPVLGDVVAFGWTADGEHVVYAADQEHDEAFQVLSAALDPRSVAEPARIHSLGGGSKFRLSPDGGWAAFRQVPTCEPPPYCTPTASLLGAPVDGSAPPERWNTTLGGYAELFRFSPAGGQIVFREKVNAYHDSYVGLFSHPTQASGDPVSLTEPPGLISVFSGWISRFVFTPDGARVVFLQVLGSDHALWSVPVDRGEEPVAVAVVSGTGSVMPTFRPTDDGLWVVFVAALTGDEGFELFRAPLDGSAPPARLGPPLASFAEIDPGFLLAGDDVLFVADLEQDEEWGLWSTPVSPGHGGVVKRLSAKPAPGGGVARGLVRQTGEAGEEGPQPQFAVSLAAGQVVFRSDERTPGQVELLSAPLDGSADPVRLNAPLAPGAEVSPFGFRITSDGTRVVYSAPDTAGNLRLHAAPIDGSAPAIPLGGAFVPGGNLVSHAQDGTVFAFDLTPDGTAVVYVADQIEDETYELFVAPTDGSAPARRLNRALVPGGDVRLIHAAVQPAFAIGPDGRRVLYCADQDTDEVFELFVSELEPRRVRPAPRPR